MCPRKKECFTPGTLRGKALPNGNSLRSRAAKANSSSIEFIPSITHPQKRRVPPWQYLTPKPASRPCAEKVCLCVVFVSMTFRAARAAAHDVHTTPEFTHPEDIFLTLPEPRRHLGETETGTGSFTVSKGDKYVTFKGMRQSRTMFRLRNRDVVVSRRFVFACARRPALSAERPPP